MNQLRPRFSNVLATFSLSAFIALSSSYAVAQPPEHAKPADSALVKQSATDHTQALIALQKAWNNAGQSTKSKALSRLMAKAEERHATLTELIKSDPAAAFSIAIPEQQQLALPNSVLAMLEQEQEIEGQLETIYEDYEDGSHQLHHFLNTDFGERFELHSADKELKLLSGAKVRAKGLLIGNNSSNRHNIDGHLALDTGNNEGLITLAADGNNTGTVTGETLAVLPNTFGEQKTAVILVNFQDDTSQPWTKDQVRDTVFNQSSDFFMENSFQQTWLNGDVVGWFTLPLSSSSCDYKAIASAALQAAEDSGVNTANYSRRVYAFPFNSACGWAGLGSVGGSPSSAWINGFMDLRTVSHELGHNFGLYHSHSLECGSAVTGTNCTNKEYGDSTDVMGQATSHFTSFQKEQLGWLDSNSITTVTNSGNFNLDTYATLPSNAPKALKVLKETDSVSGKKTWYYLEFRRPTGFDSTLATNMNSSDGIVIHTGSESSRNTSYLLDMTPESSIQDWYDAALTTGYTFSDNNAGIAITSSLAGAQNAEVIIDMAPQSCSQSAPRISASPIQSDWLAAGSAFNYFLTVTNQSSSNCSPTSFSLASDNPSGWSAQLSATNATLAPGESTTVTLTVTSAATATDGIYSLTFQASGEGYTANQDVAYVVDNPVADNSAPTAVNDSIIISTKNSVIIPVLDNDSDPDGDTLSITTVSQGSKGDVQFNNDGSLTYIPGKHFKSTDTFSYTVSDGVASASASVTIQLQSSDDSTGGNTGGKGNGKKR